MQEFITYHRKIGGISDIIFIVNQIRYAVDLGGVKVRLDDGQIEVVDDYS